MKKKVEVTFTIKWWSSLEKVEDAIKEEDDAFK